MSRRQKYRILLGVGILIAAVYLIGAIFYSRHFCIRGSVFGVELANAGVKEMKSRIADKLKEYQLNIVTRDGQETITGDMVDLIYKDQGGLEQMLKDQRQFLWFIQLFRRQEDVRMDVSLNEELLHRAVDGLSCMQEEAMTPPTDAYIDYADNQFHIVEETAGNELEPEKTYAAIRDSIYGGKEEVSLDEQGCYVPPQIYRDNESLIHECEEVNHLLTVTITYDFGDRSEVVDADEIADWIYFKDDFAYDLDWDKMYDFVYQLGLKYDTLGLSRKFTTHGGKTITLTGGDYGWCIHKNNSTEALRELILAGESVTTEPVYLYKGVERSSNDIGGTYVEVSIAEQTMWCYNDGECIVSTPVVTGNESNDHATPAGGVWAIDARISPYVLTGQDYNSEVEYWLPFNGNVGIHDASWRDEFGGNIYKTRGSHGCVNTPTAAMKKVYETMRIGYPVIVY